ncbi:probable transcription factor KAN4 isoform X5 [Malus domestica]|uniref:probable transcription factor KAN4 isoform X5 n=1 Tax=Malus domestica TaxID=3750 RepID=UPI003975DF8F
MRDGAQWFVENTDIKLVGNDDPLQGEIAWNRTPRELGLSAYALQQLGGSHAATPNQIRELMKVDGLTNDEVKSHLQVRILWEASRKFNFDESKARDAKDRLETVASQAQKFPK